jgi:hypothetical protein
MASQKIDIRTLVLILMMVVAAAMRFFIHKLSLIYPDTMSNFTPFGAIALFGGAYFKDKWKAYLAVFLTLLLSDIVINYMITSKLVWWRDGSQWVYITFMLMVLIGSFIKKVNIVNVAVASLASVCLHWLITDLPFLYGGYYPNTLSGYGKSLVAALPFERNMIYADILFCAILFGGFELAKSKYVVLRSNKELAF